MYWNVGLATTDWGSPVAWRENRQTTSVRCVTHNVRPVQVGASFNVYSNLVFRPFFNHALSVPRDQAYSLNLDCIQEVFPKSSLQHRLLGCRKCVGCVVLVDTDSRRVFFLEQLQKTQPSRASQVES